MTDAISAILAAQAAALRQTVVTIDASVVPAGTASTTAIRKGTTKSDHFLGSKTKADRFDGGDGDDAIFGHGGNDELYGGNGNDFINGGTGNDKLYGGTGNDVILGETGNDQAYGGSGNDTINGGAGNDTLYGENGSDDLRGGQGNDRLEGGSGRNSLYGDEGNDTLVGVRHGSGRMDGGSGNDTFLISGGGYDITGGAGMNTLDLSGIVREQFGTMLGVQVNTDRGVISGIEDGQIFFTEIEKFVGSVGNDQIHTSGLMSHTYFGGKGDDRFITADGDSNVAGGEGNDTYVVGINYGGVHRIKYESDHDTLIIDRDPASADITYNIFTNGADLIVKYQALNLKETTITVEGGAAAYRDGRFGIAEAQQKDFPAICPNYTTVGGAVNLGGGNSMVGGKMNDTLSVFNSDGDAQYNSHVTMTGGGGADTFIIGAQTGSITIEDYSLLQRDKIKFDKTIGITNFTDLRNYLFDGKEGAHVSIIGGDSSVTEVLLKGVDLQELWQAHESGFLLF
jgi:Ca2+-binding RTX toxin-like protein